MGSDRNWREVRSQIDQAINKGFIENSANEKMTSGKALNDCQRLYVLNKADLGIESASSL